jgi:outer membrane protein assembly factor BamB
MPHPTPPRRQYVGNGDVSGTPTLYNGRLYFTAWGGWVFCLNATTSQALWIRAVTDLLRDAGVVVG